LTYSDSQHSALFLFCLKGGGLPRSSAEGGWYRGAAPLTISSFSLAEFGFTEILPNFSLGGKFFVL